MARSRTQPGGTRALAPISAVAFVLCSACPSPRQYEGPIPIDQAGFAERFGRACALGGAQTENCAPRASDEADAAVADEPAADASEEEVEEGGGYRGSRDAGEDPAAVAP